MSYENISEPKPCLDAINGSFGWSHAEQAAHLYEENDNPDNYNPAAVEEIVHYLSESMWSDDSDAQYIVEYGEEILRRFQEGDWGEEE